MERSNIIRIVIGIGAAVLLVFFYLTNDQTKSFNWDTHFKSDSKDPYGTYLFHELLKAERNSTNFIDFNSPISEYLLSLENINANYIFIGNIWHMTDDDIMALTDFVQKGNNAYIISRESPTEILNYTSTLGLPFHSLFTDSAVVLHNIDSINTLSVTFKSGFKTIDYEWIYMDSVSYSSVTPLGGYDQKKINFFKVEEGKGSYYFHFTPLAFTNYNLKSENALNYANSILTDFKTGTIYWDNYSQNSHEESSTQSPLAFILSQPSLRWSWYILLCAAAVYLFLYTKRKQRAIPIISKTTNSSLEFVKTIAGMYFQENSNKLIITNQYNLLLTFIRTHYEISTNKIDDSFFKKTGLKSGINHNSIDTIFNEYKRLMLIGDITEKDLISFDKLTKSFYQNCKK